MNQLLPGALSTTAPIIPLGSDKANQWNAKQPHFKHDQVNTNFWELEATKVLQLSNVSSWLRNDRLDCPLLRWWCWRRATICTSSNTNTWMILDATMLTLPCCSVNTPLLLPWYSSDLFSIKPCSKDWALCSVTCGGKSDRSRMVGKLRNRSQCQGQCQCLIVLIKVTTGEASYVNQQGIFQSLTNPISWHSVLLG